MIDTTALIGLNLGKVQILFSDSSTFVSVFILLITLESFFSILFTISGIGFS